jgi:hypothetical protein
MNTSELREFLPHRPPLVWVDEVLSFSDGPDGPSGICRVLLTPGRAFHGPHGVRPSSVLEWIAQGYGFMKSALRLEQGLGPAKGRVFLVGVNDVEIDLAGIESEKSVLVHVREQRNLHPAYLLEGRVTAEDGTRVFGRARMKVFAGELP